MQYNVPVIVNYCMVGPWFGTELNALSKGSNRGADRDGGWVIKRKETVYGYTQRVATDKRI